MGYGKVLPPSLSAQTYLIAYSGRLDQKSQTGGVAPEQKDF